MKSFKDLGVSYAPADGKKRFPGPSISIRELVNLPIVVKDYETGIKTDQGDGRTEKGEKDEKQRKQGETRQGQHLGRHQEFAQNSASDNSADAQD